VEPEHNSPSHSRADSTRRPRRKGLVGGPVFLESVIEGAARHTVENIKHAANEKTHGRKEPEVAVGELADAFMEMPPSDRDIVARKRGPDVTLSPVNFR
jgi:hypothetical protein